jgi:hypothetical protein
MTPEQRADLEQSYLLALLKRDAKIWRARIEAPALKGVGVTIVDDDDDEPDKPKPHRIPAVTYRREDPCNRCGTNMRYVSTGNCVVCQKARDKRADAARNAAQKRAAASHPVHRPGLRLTQVRAVPTMPKKEAVAVVQHVAPSPIPPAVLVSSCAAAKAAGDARYIRDQPCKTCGGVEFYTGNRSCVECHKRAKQLRKLVVVPQTPKKFVHTEYEKARRFASR